MRTGCLTCRERHLKCDEGMPICLNCKKSNRQCKRGVRLNFIDTKVEETQMVPQTSESIHSAYLPSAFLKRSPHIGRKSI